MSQSAYEGMFILDSNRYTRDPGGVAGQITSMIEKFGGTILVSRLWEERRLAYPIKGQRKAAYWLVYFRGPGDAIPKIERECQISDTILRQLVLKVDERIIDALVSHAKGELPTQQEAPKERRAAETEEPATANAEE